MTGLLKVALVSSLWLSALSSHVHAQDITLSPAKLRRAVGSPSSKWVCPKQDAVLRFHLEKGAKRHLTSHDGGECVPLVKKREASYKIWIESRDAVVLAFVLAKELDPIVQGRVRLTASPNKASREYRNKPGVYVDAGTPVEAKESQGSRVHVMLPKADILASGWLQESRLKITGRRSKVRRRAKGQAIWISGTAELLDSPKGTSLARIARPEKFVAAKRVDSKDGYILVSYAGRHATAVGWIRTSETRERETPSSDTAIGMAKIEDNEYWAEAGQALYDRPQGEKIGVFRQDADLVGARLKNGWVHFPIATELGTFNLWSPLY